MVSMKGWGTLSAGASNEVDWKHMVGLFYNYKYERVGDFYVIDIEHK